MLKKCVAVLALACAACASAQAQSCTRDSLKALIAEYFKAVETHDTSALPVAVSLRITENGQEVKLGQGFMKSGGAVHLQRDLVDTERCGTVTEAVTDETVNGAQTLAIVAVRLKAEQGKVIEIETIVTREAEMKRFYNPQALLATKDQDWTTPLPPGKRPTREQMNDGANKYFDDFSNNPPAEPPFAEQCDRWEGGTHTTPKHDCSAKGLVLTHTHRRFPVTDLELGETAGFINFGGGLPDVHIFKYNADGKIYLINAVFGGRQQGLIWPDEPK
jgi:hypothetical protein